MTYVDPKTIQQLHNDLSEHFTKVKRTFRATCSHTHNSQQIIIVCGKIIIIFKTNSKQHRNTEPPVEYKKGGHQQWLLHLAEKFGERVRIDPEPLNLMNLVNPVSTDCREAEHNHHHTTLPQIEHSICQSLCQLVSKQTI